MATNLNQTSLSDAIKVKYETRLLIRAYPRLLHGRWAKKATISKFGSYELRRYESMSAITSALNENVTPAEQAAPTLTLVTLSPLFYGAWIGYGDEIDMTVFDPLVSEVSGILGEQAGLSADTLIRNDLTANASKRYSNGKASRATLDFPNDIISYSDVVDAYAQLMAQNALPMEGEYFIVLIHPHTYASLMKDPTFVNAFQKANEGAGAMNNPMPGYLGDFLMCKFFISSNVREYTDGGVGTDDVYSMLFLGRESYGLAGFGNLLPSDVDSGGSMAQPLTGQQVKPVEIIAKQLGSAGADDPLNQRATIGWKMTLDNEILNSSFLLDLEHVNEFSAS
jgi:N4-gp56 family major capsid protein